MDCAQPVKRDSLWRCTKQSPSKVPGIAALHGVIVFFLQIDTLGPKNVRRDKHLQNRLFEVPCAFGAN